MKNFRIRFDKISMTMNNFFNIVSEVLFDIFFFFAFLLLIRGNLIFILLYLWLDLFKLVLISLHSFEFLLFLFVKFSIKFFIFRSKLIIYCLISLNSSFSLSMKIYLLLFRLIRTCLQNLIKINFKTYLKFNVFNMSLLISFKCFNLLSKLFLFFH